MQRQRTSGASSSPAPVFSPFRLREGGWGVRFRGSEQSAFVLCKQIARSGCYTLTAAVYSEPTKSQLMTLKKLSMYSARRFWNLR